MTATDADQDYTKRTIYVTPEAWRQARLAAAMLSNELDEPVSVTEIARRGLRREIEAVTEGDDYEPPGSGSP